MAWWWLLLPAVGLGVFLWYLGRNGYLQRSPLASAHCPTCGRRVDEEADCVAFTRPLDPCPPGALVEGYEVRCGHCRTDSVFTRDGRFVGLGKAKDHLTVTDDDDEERG